MAKKPPGVETLFKVKSWFRNYLEDDQKLFIVKVVFLRKRTDLLPQNCRLKIPFEILDTFLVTFFKIAGKTVRLDRCCDKILQIQVVFLEVENNFEIVIKVTEVAQWSARMSHE